MIAPVPAWLTVLRMVLFGIGAVSCWWFVIIYTRSGFKWWHSDVGRNLIMLSASLGAIYTWSVAVTIWPGLPGRLLIGTVLFLIVTAAMIWRVVVFRRVARDVRQAQREAEQTPPEPGNAP